MPTKAIVERSYDDRRPVVTWASMSLALILTFLLPLWSNHGGPALVWGWYTLVFLGIAGGVAAIFVRCYLWAAASTAWGFILAYGMFLTLMAFATGP